MNMKDILWATRSSSRFKSIFVAGWVLCLLLTPLQGIAQGEGGFTPWDFKGPTATGQEPEKEREPAGFSAKILLAGVSFFTDHISRVDGDRCPMMPTCSAYSKLAIKKHGFFVGIMMTADRLIHEANEMEYAPLVRVGDKIRFYDPVENNDFWWTSPREKKKE